MEKTNEVKKMNFFQLYLQSILEIIEQKSDFNFPPLVYCVLIGVHYF
jgi:hypothetical protein